MGKSEYGVSNQKSTYTEYYLPGNEMFVPAAMYEAKLTVTFSIDIFAARVAQAAAGSARAEYCAFEDASKAENADSFHSELSMIAIVKEMIQNTSISKMNVWLVLIYSQSAKMNFEEHGIRPGIVIGSPHP